MEKFFIGGNTMDIINKLVEFIQNFIQTIKDLVASIREKNDQEG